MMKKGVAVPYIIAILLGIAVIGLVGYWLFVSGGKLGGAATTQDCQSKKLTFCNIWHITNYAGPDPGWDQACTSLGVNKPLPSDCIALTGTLKGRGESCDLNSATQNNGCQSGLSCGCPTGYTQGTGTNINQCTKTGSPTISTQCTSPAGTISGP